MLADPCTPGDNPDVHQVEIPEAAQPCIACDGDVERAAQLDAPVHARRGRGAIGGINGVGDVAGSVYLSAQELEEGVRFSVDSSGQLDLFHHLVGAVVKLLLCGYDAEQVDDECQ